MFNKLLIIIISFSGLLFSANSKPLFDTYDKLIISYPQFLESNYFEDDDYYYYLDTYEYTDMGRSKRSKRNAKKNIRNKIKLKVMSNLSGSICCGFDISNIRSILRNINIVDKNNHQYAKFFELKKHTSDITAVEDLIIFDNNESIIYGVRINKQNISIEGCECNLVID